MKYAICEILTDISGEGVSWDSINTGLRAVSAIVRYAQSCGIQWDNLATTYITHASIDFAWRHVTNEPEIDYEAILRIWQDLPCPEWARSQLIALRNEMMDMPLNQTLVIRTNAIINQVETPRFQTAPF